MPESFSYRKRKKTEGEMVETDPQTVPSRPDNPIVEPNFIKDLKKLHDIFRQMQ